MPSTRETEEHRRPHRVVPSGALLHDSRRRDRVHAVTEAALGLHRIEVPMTAICSCDHGMNSRATLDRVGGRPAPRLGRRRSSTLRQERGDPVG